MRTFAAKPWVLEAVAGLFPRWFGRSVRTVVCRHGPCRCGVVRPPRRAIVPRLELIESRESPTSLLWSNPATLALAATSVPVTPAPAVQTAPKPVLDIVSSLTASTASIRLEQTSASAGSAERHAANSAPSESSQALPLNSQAGPFAANFEALFNPDVLFADPFGGSSSGGRGSGRAGPWDSQPAHPTNNDGGGSAGGGSSFSGGQNQPGFSGGAGNPSDSGSAFGTQAPPSNSGNSSLASGNSGSPGNSSAGLPSPLLLPFSQPAPPMSAPPSQHANPQSSPQTNPQGQGPPPAGPLHNTGPTPDDTPPDFNSGCT